MDPEKEAEDWEFDETKTLRAMLRLYVKKLENEKNADKSQFVTREEFCQVAVAFINCLDRIVRHDEKLLCCVDRLTGHVEMMTHEIAALKNKLADLGDAEN